MCLVSAQSLHREIPAETAIPFPKEIPPEMQQSPARHCQLQQTRTRTKTGMRTRTRTRKAVMTSKRKRKLERSIQLLKQISLLEIVSTCSSATSYGCRSSGVFCAIDSAALQPVHRCTPAPYGMLAVPAVLPTHSFGDMDHW